MAVPDKGLRTFSWSCFLYGQPLACSVFYRAFPAQRLFDPRMVVPVDVFAGEAAGLLARAFLPMPGDARTRAFIRPKNPSAAALSGLHPFALMDRTRPCRPIRSSHPGHRQSASAVAVRPRDARRHAAWRRPDPASCRAGSAFGDVPTVCATTVSKMNI